MTSPKTSNTPAENFLLSLCVVAGLLAYGIAVASLVTQDNEVDAISCAKALNLAKTSRDTLIIASDKKCTWFVSGVVFSSK